VSGDAGALAAFAALLADRTRATFCMQLLDGRAWTPGELARTAGVAASTATEHVNQLVAGGLLAEERQGRHRYVRLADARAAQVIEDLAAYATPGGGQPDRPTLRAATVAAALRDGRTCYDHLAGHIGIVLIGALTERGLLGEAGGLAMTDAGLRWLGGFGIDVGALAASKRPLVRPCLDWTERRPHLAGSVGASICTRFFERGWIQRIGSDRAVRVTPAGRAGFAETLGVDPAELVRPA
jgi:DNA-binding transcriptional ArsR family regulator